MIEKKLLLAERANFCVAALLAGAVIFEMLVLPMQAITVALVAVLIIMTALAIKRGVSARRQRKS